MEEKNNRTTQARDGTEDRVPIRARILEGRRASGFLSGPQEFLKSLRAATSQGQGRQLEYVVRPPSASSTFPRATDLFVLALSRCEPYDLSSANESHSRASHGQHRTRSYHSRGDLLHDRGRNGFRHGAKGGACFPILQLWGREPLQLWGREPLQLLGQGAVFSSSDSRRAVRTLRLDLGVGVSGRRDARNFRLGGGRWNYLL